MLLESLSITIVLLSFVSSETLQESVSMLFEPSPLGMKPRSLYTSIASASAILEIVRNIWKHVPLNFLGPTNATLCGSTHKYRHPRRRIVPFFAIFILGAITVTSDL